MGYDQNNEYYNSGDQSWRDQTNVYQTQREQPTPMGRRSPRRTGGWLKGILAVLLVVAISFGAFYLMRNVGVRLERTEDGVTLSMTNRSKQPEPEQAEQPIPEPSASAQTGTQTAAPQQTTQQPTQGAYVGSGSTSSQARKAPTRRFPTRKTRCAYRISTARSLTPSFPFRP